MKKATNLNATVRTRSARTRSGLSFALCLVQLRQINVGPNLFNLLMHNVNQ